MIQQLLATGAMHPQTPLNPCTTFMLCLPMSGLELPVCSVEMLYCANIITHMTDKYINWQASTVTVSMNIKNQKAKRCIKKVPKVKKDVFNVGIEPRMVNSLQIKELGVQSTTAVYFWFGNSIFN